MNKSLALLFIGAITLAEYADALQVTQKESLPDYWNDYRFSGNKGWDDAENTRYGDPDAWVLQSRTEAPGQVDAIEMTNAEVQYRWAQEGKRGTGYKWTGTTYGLGEK